MTRTVTRESTAPELSFREIYEGETPCSLDITLNAKGQYQYALKLYFTAEGNPALRATQLAYLLDTAEAFDRDFRERFDTPNGQREPRLMSSLATGEVQP